MLCPLGRMKIHLQSPPSEPGELESPSRSGQWPAHQLQLPICHKLKFFNVVLTLFKFHFHPVPIWLRSFATPAWPSYITALHLELYIQWPSQRSIAVCLNKGLWANLNQLQRENSNKMTVPFYWYFAKKHVASLKLSHWYEPLFLPVTDNMWLAEVISLHTTADVQGFISGSS